MADKKPPMDRRTLLLTVAAAMFALLSLVLLAQGNSLRARLADAGYRLDEALAQAADARAEADAALAAVAPLQEEKAALAARADALTRGTPTSPACWRAPTRPATPLPTVPMASSGRTAASMRRIPHSPPSWPPCRPRPTSLQRKARPSRPRWMLPPTSSPRSSIPSKRC